MAYYRFLKNGEWGPTRLFGVEECVGADADHVGPTISADKAGVKYVAFAGRDRIAHVFAIDSLGAASPIMKLDPEKRAISGGKYRNPNVDCHTDRHGAYVAWGIEKVYLRSVRLAPGKWNRSGGRKSVRNR